MSSSSSMMSMRRVIGIRNCKRWHARNGIPGCVHILRGGTQHSKYQCLHLLCLHPGLGKESGWPKLKLVAFGIAQIARRVDEHGQRLQLRMMAQALHQAEAIAIRQTDVQDDQIRCE